MCGAKEAQFVRCSADTNTKCEIEREREARAELAFPIINRLKYGLEKRVEFWSKRKVWSSRSKATSVRQASYLSLNCKSGSKMAAAAAA